MICNLCPRRCGVLRTETEGEGWCRMPALPVAARAALHHWEEPPISGKRGSGTVFFSGCSLGCVFCQNEAISHRDFGKALTVPRLREICLELIRQGAHNINFVNPTHYAHIVRQVLEEPLPVPVVWNTGGYDRVKTLRALEGRVDVYLPDLKYLDPETAGRYSAAPDYPGAAQAAIEEMFRQTGPCQFDEAGLLTRGVVIRHLILPGQTAQAKADGLGGPDLPQGGGPLLADEPVHPLGGPERVSRAGPPPPPGGDGELRGLYAESGSARFLSGAHQRPGGVHPSL